MADTRQQLDTEQSTCPCIDPRFVYVELRLSRLGKIYAIAWTLMRGYMARRDCYGAFFHNHFAWLASHSIHRRVGKDLLAKYSQVPNQSEMGATGAFS